MNRFITVALGVWIAAFFALFAQASAQEPSLSQAVPSDVYLLAYGRENPEREYLRPYYEEIYNTIQETRIIPRALEIVTSRMEEGDLERAEAVFEEVQSALAPIDVQALLHSKELVYAQAMKTHSSQHLLLLRMTPDGAAGCSQGIRNLFAVAEKYSGGKVSIQTSSEHGVPFVSLAFPPGVPFRPTVASIDDVLLCSSSRELAGQSLALLLTQEGDSKLADERFQDALCQLPEPEDGLVVYDAKTQFRQFRQSLESARRQVGENEEANRWLSFANMILDELDVVDYILTVEYTDGYRNCTASFGRVQPDYESKLLTRLAGSGEAFENWETWVPADAVSFSLSRGVNLHALYAFVENVIQERIPEAHEAWSQFETWQAEMGIHLDRDVLRAFSGESVSITLPAASNGEGQETFWAVRCHNPERIRELLHRLVDQLQQVPFLQPQQLKLSPSEEMEGFEELSGAMLQMFEVRPVIGFRDGWMMVGSSAEAIQRILATRAGEAPTFVESDAFARFDMPIEGSVLSIRYSNLAESTRQMAEFLEGAGMIMPMVIGMAGAQADSEQLRLIQDIVALLPDVGKVVAKFDFLEGSLSVVQDGPTDDIWLQRSVTLVRAPGVGATLGEE